MVRRVSLAILALAVAGCLAPSTSASAKQVRCGDTITKDTKLDRDLTDCPGDGIVIGADGITLDLNRHTVETLCETVCTGQTGIDNSGGYDRVRILNGTVRRFEHTIALVGAHHNTLAGLTVDFLGRRDCELQNCPGNGLFLSHSNHNKLRRSTISGGAPAVLISASDRNTILRSSIFGGVAIHTGGTLELRDGSDHNQVLHSQLDQDLAQGAAGIFESTGNRFARNSVRGGIGLLRSKTTVIAHNAFVFVHENTYNVSIGGDENVVRHNEFPPRFPSGAVAIRGDRNRVQHNRVHSGPADLQVGTIDVVSGAANLVLGNDVSLGVFRGFEGISVQPDATDTLVQGNLATHATVGIHVEAPGTVVRGNIANDNGDLGIKAVAGVIDGGGNKAHGNGNPAQCLNVVCK